MVTLAGGSPDAVAGEAFDVSNFSSTTLPEITVTNFDITDMSREELQLLLNEIDKALGSIATAASDLGAIKTRISSQQSFVGKIIDAVSRGIGQLVDADMEAESTRLQAFQVQQQLGIQALSIANSNAQNVLRLFQN